MILPPAERRDEIRFIFARSLPYNVRIVLIAFSVFLGLLLQLVLPGTVTLWMGAAFLFLGALLGVVKGYSNVPRKIQRANREFQICSRKEFEDILEINRRSKRWDRSLVDVTSPLGILAL